MSEIVIVHGSRNGPVWFWWAVHNIIAHPLSELLHWVRLDAVANWLHDETIPIHTSNGQG